MTILQFFVLFATLIWIELLGGPEVLTIVNKAVVIATMLAIAAVNYLGVYRGDRFDRFEKERQSWTPARRRRGTTLAVAFLVLHLAYGLLAFIADARHHRG